MHASITVAQVNRDRIDDVGPLYQRLEPSLRAASGWLGVYVVIDRATGDGHLLGLWETEDDARAFETSGAFQRVLADYPPGLLAGPPHRTLGEVVFHASK
ncbi:MAG: antibiotic biosynthesis monooxygenase [Candidatus Dormibacteraeota bacterium]|nr:antibiotic biosynthesis monooxygenase [Candidatus Dormibacteraeota bacterium]